MKIFLALLLLTACQKTATITSFDGWAMTMPYHIAIGHPLTPEQHGQIFNVIQSTFHEVDQTLNNWNPHSEISRLNQAPANTPLLLSPHLHKLLLLCQEIHSLSHQKFDPTIEPLKHTSFAEAQHYIGWHHLLLENNTLTKHHPNTALDLCALSKGYCIDLITERLQQIGLSNLFIEWAGEIRAVGAHPEHRPWMIQIEPDPSHEPIALESAAIATSSNTLQDHIIDPATGKNPPKQAISAATVIAPTCAFADALATAAMLFPSREAAEQWAQEITKKYPEVKIWLF